MDAEAEALADMPEHNGGVAGLGNEIVRSETGAVHHHLAVDETGQHDHVAAVPAV